MKICHVLHGRSRLPPQGWAPLEQAVWELREFCEAAGHDFYLVNTTDAAEVMSDIADIRPDVVHVHCEAHFRLVEQMPVPVRILSSEWPRTYEPQNRQMATTLLGGTAQVACVSSKVASYCVEHLQVAAPRVFLCENGAWVDRINYLPVARQPDRAVCIASINARKRQHFLAEVAAVDVAGPVRPTLRERKGPLYSTRNPRYQGEWSHAETRTRLTHYGTFVLLSGYEVAPTIIAEAMAAGLGLVLSRQAAAHLEPGLPFVDVVADEDMADPVRLAAIVAGNLARAARLRSEIRARALADFDFAVIAGRYLERLERMLEESR